jgi:hypothetical protein
MSPWRRPRRQFQASRQIPFPIRSRASRWPLGGTGTPPAGLKATPISLADASRVPGPGQGLRISVGDPPPPLILPSAPRQFGQSGGSQAGWEPLEDLAGRGGRTRGPRLEAIPPLLRAEGSTAGSSGRGLAKDTPGATSGRPGPFRRLFQAQTSLKAVRCHRITVAGWTTEMASVQPAHRRDRRTQNRRSAVRSRGRGTVRRKRRACSA